MENIKTHWQLHEFALDVGKHFTTINDWFNKLENKKIHYVSKSDNGERVYDLMDMKIALYIKSKREEGWGLTPTFNVLVDQEDLELRAVPINLTTSGDENKPVSMAELKQLFQSEITDYITNSIQSTIQETLPQLIDPLQQRKQRIDDLLTQHKINSKLQIEALEAWSKLAKEDRTIKVGIFKREEDVSKRELYIYRYIASHYESELKKEFGLEDNDVTA